MTFLPCLTLKHPLLPSGQPTAAVFTVLAQLYGPRAKETEVDAVFFNKEGPLTF